MSPADCCGARRGRGIPFCRISRCRKILRARACARTTSFHVLPYPPVLPSPLLPRAIPSVLPRWMPHAGSQAGLGPRRGSLVGTTRGGLRGGPRGRPGLSPNPEPRPACPNRPMRRPPGAGKVGGRERTGRGVLSWGEAVCRHSDTLWVLFRVYRLCPSSHSSAEGVS